MILEGIVTTVSPEGVVNIAPMGPRIALPLEPDGSLRQFILRPYQTSTTLANLLAHPEGVFHVVDDVLLLARAAIGRVDPLPPLRDADLIRGRLLADSCRAYEFRLTSIDTSTERTTLEARVVHSHRLRDFFGFNRARHAVVEAAILATRKALLPIEDILAEFRRLDVLVDKTGGPAEREAMELLKQHVSGSA